MRFLVDAQLPPALAEWLKGAGAEAWHVRSIGLMSATDTAIWREANRRGAVVITKDADFVSLSGQNPHGPAVIHVRIGNTTSRHLLARWSAAWPKLKAALGAGEKLITVDENGP